MGEQATRTSDEIKELQRCINDLVSVLALPAIWTGRDPSHIGNTLLDALLGILELDLVYFSVNNSAGSPPIEMLRFGRSVQPELRLQNIAALIKETFRDDPHRWPAIKNCGIGGRNITLVPAKLGLRGEIGVVVAGCERPGFPRQTESLILSIAANQASIGFQEARLLMEQKRVSDELDRRVAERTAELAVKNEELTKEIADRKRAEEQFRRSEAFLAEGQHLAQIGNFSWVVETDEIKWSEQLYRIFEFAPDTTITFELIGSRVHPEDLPLMQEMIAKAQRAVADYEYEHRLLMPDGSVKFLHLTAHASRDSQGRVEYIGAVQDVTRRRTSEVALAKAKSELSKVARITSMGVLTASIAHEINQPLSGIITNASTCLRMLSAESPNFEGAQETARRTIRDANRASDVVARLRALFARKPSVFEPINLNDVCREVIALSSGELTKNRIVLQTEFHEDLPLVSGDRVQLQQVILNLLRNGSEAMSEIENRPRVLSIKTGPASDDHVCLSVQDCGVGFGQIHAEKLFEAFYTTKDNGMGIGLSVSRSIVESHQGRLWATPNDGPGATFSFSIPCARSGPGNDSGAA